MLDSEIPKNFQTEIFIREIKRLIFGRLSIYFLLLLGSWWWSNNFLEFSIRTFPNRVFLLFITTIALTFIYLLMLGINKNYGRQIQIQFLIDVFLITWFVKETGDVLSPYVTLYIVLITVVGFFFGRFGTMLISLMCAASFTLMAFLTHQVLMSSFSGDLADTKFVQNLAFNNVSMLIVGLLAAYISDRRRIGERLRETEESFANLHVLYERILASIPTGLMTTDLEGEIHSFNPAAELISGVRLRDAVGASAFSIFGDVIRPEVYACINDAIVENSFPTKHFEAVIKMPSGKHSAAQKVSVACSVSPLIGKRGSVYGLIWTFQDITQIRAMEETLRKSDRMAAVGRMAAGLAHEIRNPLGSMSSALQYLQEKVPSETSEGELMEVVLKESDRLNKIITNFLSYARPKSNIFSKESFHLTDVNEAIRSCLMLLRHSPEAKETHLFETALPEKPVIIEANETQIKQVLWNVLRNSLQAMPAGGKLFIKLKDNPGRNCQITFEDTGCGIGDEQMRHLFEPFSSGGGGTGLGLSIVHQIVKDHGGHIDIQSRANVGTKIIIEFPH